VATTSANEKNEHRVFSQKILSAADDVQRLSETRKDAFPLFLDKHMPLIQDRQLKCSIGMAPWVNLNILEELKSFSRVFAMRPGRFNVGGTGFFHAFGLWCVIRSKKPSTIIESGIHNGLGTWIMRQAAGNHTKFILVSPSAPGIYKDESRTTQYFTGNKFRDFNDLPWNLLVPDKNDSLIFFDDHQAGIRRIKEARKFGFKFVMFDDNYIPGHGDNLSAKKLCNPNIYSSLNNPVFTYQDDFGKKSRRLSNNDYFVLVQDFRDSVHTYAEFPPVWNGPNRIGVTNEIWSSIGQPALFNFKAVHSFAGIQIDVSESLQYTHFVYMELFV